MDRLFDLPQLVETNGHAREPYQALGAAAELMLASRLVELGHKVAIPVTDDDGVDLVVNYRIKVQIKTSAQRHSCHSGGLMVNCNTRRWSEREREIGRVGKLMPHVDIVAIRARDTGSWWFIPRDLVPGDNLLVHEHTGKYSRWLEAWNVFD